MAKQVVANASGWALAKPGDLNLYDAVDLTDFVIMKAHFGTGTWSDGDCDGDGDVDLADFNILKTNFNTGLTISWTSLGSRPSWS